MLDVEAVRELFGRMQMQNPLFRDSFASRHQYRLGPTIPEAELLAFEERYQLRLPPEYRHFLKNIGNGNGTPRTGFDLVANSAPGPCYGLLPFEDTTLGCAPGRPFLWDEADARPDGIPVEIEEDEAGNTQFSGMLRIGYQGCSGFYHLVVHGNCYGTIWANWDEVIYPTGLTFDDWYSRWLSELRPPQLPKKRSG